MRSIEYKTAIARQENAELVRFIESIYRSIISYADETSGEELGELIAQLKERRKSNSASVSTFISWLENPLLRMVIRFSGDRHLRSGESYLKAALDDIAEEGSGDRSIARSSQAS